MRARGFTLVEIVLSMALVGLVLVGLNTFVFSMGELWGKNTDSRLFDQHVRAVTHFLQNEMLKATLPPAAVLNSTPVGVQLVKPENGLQENLITYSELAGNRILRWQDVPLPEVVCSWQVRKDQGMYMLWHSDLENNFNTDPPRETLVSPLVTGISYDYFDTDFNKWTTETVLRTDSGGNPLAPQRLRVSFGYNGLTREALIPVPAIQQGMPNPW
jgi:prepilin-type N-terminal cleavage/methylation domain-containing protein